MAGRAVAGALAALLALRTVEAVAEAGVCERGCEAKQDDAGDEVPLLQMAARPPVAAGPQAAAAVGGALEGGKPRHHAKGGKVGKGGKKKGVAAAAVAEDPPTVIQPPGSLPTCKCAGNPHVGGLVPGMECLPWSESNDCGTLRLSQWANNASCSLWVGSRYCAESPCPAESTGFNWIFGTDATSKCKLQYIGAYQFDGSDFQRVDSSSFNCEGAFPPQDLNPKALNSQLANGSMWLPPYPGGSAEWVAGFTPYDTMARYADGAEVLALGGPAFMIVAKFSGELSHIAWYVLNERTLLNGATCLNPNGHANGNCWGCGYGEVDILEGNYCEPNLCMTLTNGLVPGYGSCLYGETAREDTYEPGEDGESPLIAAVFDHKGVTVYVNPVWSGLAETTAAPTLGPRPTSAAKVVKAPGSSQGFMWSLFQDTHQLQR